MHVGALEIALLVLTGIVALIAAKRTSRGWLAGVILLAAVAMFASPADIVSMLAIAVPCSTIYCVALLRMEKRLQTNAASV